LYIHYAILPFKTGITPHILIVPSTLSIGFSRCGRDLISQKMDGRVFVG
jgi:hypothetical protein